MTSEFQIDIFHGQLSAHSAQVYARAVGLPGGGGWTIAGRMRGPECRHARSLPSNHSFVDLGPGESLLARATLPDPCFWSPDLPALYQVTVELRHGRRVVQTEERELGLRLLGTKRNSFYLGGQRWVLRGMRRELVEPAELTEWRAAGAAMLVPDPSDELCREAAREGVFLVAHVAGNDAGTFRRLSHWASVGLIACSSPLPVTTEVRRSCPNLVLASASPENRRSISEPPWSAWLMDESALRSPGHGVAASSSPIIAIRHVDGMMPLADARSECDRLQSDLAAIGDFAGYLIDGIRLTSPT